MYTISIFLEELADWLITHDHREIACIHGCSMGGACCDYFIVGDQNPLAAEYELKSAGNGLLVSVRKER